MAFHSTSSRDYVPAINSLNRPKYNSTHNQHINSKLDEILSGQDFVYDAEKDPIFQKYKQEYIELGKDAVQNAVTGAAQLTGGYGESYSAKAASQANQKYITEMSERIPQLMDAAMQKYQMEQENAYRQFNALQSDENRLYGQYRDQVGDYDRDLAGLTEGFKTAQNQENTDRDFEYKKQRDEVADARANSELQYKYARAAVEDEHWQKEFDLKKLQYENALKKAKSGSGRGRGSGNYTDADDFFKLKGTAASKSYSGNLVDTSRNATLSVNNRDKLMNQLFNAESESAAQLLLNQWAYQGQISEGDYEYLVKLYKKAKKEGITRFGTTDADRAIRWSKKLGRDMYMDTANKAVKLLKK